MSGSVNMCLADQPQPHPVNSSSLRYVQHDKTRSGVPTEGDVSDHDLFAECDIFHRMYCYCANVFVPAMMRVW